MSWIRCCIVWQTASYLRDWKNPWYAETQQPSNAASLNYFFRFCRSVPKFRLGLQFRSSVRHLNRLHQSPIPFDCTIFTNGNGTKQNFQVIFRSTRKQKRRKCTTEFLLTSRPLQVVFWVTFRASCSWTYPISSAIVQLAKNVSPACVTRALLFLTFDRLQQLKFSQWH